MKRTIYLLALLTLGSLNLTFAPRIHAQVLPAPALMNFQGRLARPDGTPVADGTSAIRFSLWDAASDGTEKWNQTLDVVIANGVFDVLLDVGAAGLFNGNLWMEIQIGTDVPLSPRQQLVSVAYAMKANAVLDGSIGANQLAPNAVTSAAIANGAVTSATIANGAVTSTAIANGAVNAANLGPDVGLWSVNDGNVFRSSGNVGIGKSNPITTLDVAGTVTATAFSGSGAGLTALPAHAALLNANQTFTGVNSFGAAKVNGANTIEFGAGVAGKELSAGKIGYQVFGPGALDIVGAGTTPANRQIRFWAEGGAQFTGAITAPSATIPTLGGNVTFNGNAKVNGANTLEFGAGVAGKEPNAGKIGYQAFGPGALDIVGAGTTAVNRQIRVWAEGGAQFTGPINAPSATIPTLNGNVTVNGEMTAKVVTITGGSDVAEPYHVAGTRDVEPVAGMVVAINPDKVGQMRVASQAYDKTVAGILSGANGIAPGITLRQVGTIADGSLPVASIGRVWCYCDADANGPIEAGDMLTTSNTPGHAMKVADFDRANGSVIGKAMSPLESGQGLVLVLVSLK